MSSKWSHAICYACWDKVEPDRKPVQLLNPQEEKCCRCGRPTESGIYYRADPYQFQCEGVHA